MFKAHLSDDSPPHSIFRWGLFQDALQSVRRIFRPRRDLAGLRLFLVAMAGDQGFVRAFLRLPARLLSAPRSALTAQRYRIRRRIFDTLLKRRIYHRFGVSQFSGMILICFLGKDCRRDRAGLISARTKEALGARRASGLPVGRPKGPGKSKLDKHRPEIEAQLANGSTQKFIAKRYNSSPANLANWMKKRGVKKPKL